MITTILAIAVIEDNGRVLLRKKPDGSPPYRETWYLFGGEIQADFSSPEEVLKNTIEQQTGIRIEPVERLSWDTEIKANHEGEETLFVYLDYRCEYRSGQLRPGPGIEKLEWAEKERLKDYDLVPPSRKLFRSLGYL